MLAGMSHIMNRQTAAAREELREIVKDFASAGHVYEKRAKLTAHLRNDTIAYDMMCVAEYISFYNHRRPCTSNNDWPFQWCDDILPSQATCVQQLGYLTVKVNFVSQLMVAIHLALKKLG